MAQRVLFWRSQSQIRRLLQGYLAQRRTQEQMEGQGKRGLEQLSWTYFDGGSAGVPMLTSTSAECG